MILRNHALLNRYTFTNETNTCKKYIVGQSIIYINRK